MKLLRIRELVDGLEDTVSNLEDSQVKHDIDNYISDIRVCIDQLENARIKISRALDEIENTIY